MAESFYIYDEDLIAKINLVADMLGVTPEEAVGIAVSQDIERWKRENALGNQQDGIKAEHI